MRNCSFIFQPQRRRRRKHYSKAKEASSGRQMVVYEKTKRRQVIYYLQNLLFCFARLPPNLEHERKTIFSICHLGYLIAMRAVGFMLFGGLV